MILVTGANGNLGSLTLAALRARGVEAIGGSRTPGEGVRLLDFDQPSGIGLTGVSTLVLVSAGYAEDDQVIRRHAAVLDAAARDGVKHVIYTSLTGAGDHLGFAPAHRATERLVRGSGLSWTILRNGLYAELFGALLMWNGDAVESAFGEGALSAVAREDLADVAAIVAGDPERHGERVYDLVGVPITAPAVADGLGVAHRTIGLGEYRRRLLDALDCCRSSRRCSPRSPPASATASWATPVRIFKTCSTALHTTHSPLLSPPRPPRARVRAERRGSRPRPVTQRAV
ncbi:NAD(P)H-binding protein [Streptomyces sp. FXJ1.4098]|nr:NAD(P)H-binding protein [Streptomyces sp. FXJ1.4098]